MSETYFSASKMLGHLRSGPSGPYLDGFAASLERQGYSPDTAVRYLRAAAHAGHIMVERGVSLGDIDLAAFSEHLRSCRCPRVRGGRRNHHAIYGARLFRRHLVELGVCRSAAVVTAPAEPKLVADFKAWLRKHRGASDATIRLYARDAAGIMIALGLAPTGWSPADVRGYFMERASKCGSGTIEKMTTSLRAFLRYLAVEGRCQAGLDNAVPAYAHWQLADMPRYLSAEQVNQLIGKARYEVRLPLPQDVGDAIAAYLECRPSACRSDRVFLRTIAPCRPFRNGDGISSVMKRVMKRAGIVTSVKGAHVLRHTAATEMLRRGVPLEKIGLVLRHRGIDTTAYYAKADVALLKQVAQPWPEAL